MQQEQRLALAVDLVVVVDAVDRFAAFLVRRAIGSPRSLANQPIDLDSSARVFALAGIARPDRFFADLSAAGWQVAGTDVFPDHHPFTAGDVDRIADHARAAGASVVVTTEKDAVRLESLDRAGLTFACVPLTVSVEPADRFAEWLHSRVKRAAAAQAAQSSPHP